jgi:hypothetical protein
MEETRGRRELTDPEIDEMLLKLPHVEAGVSYLYHTEPGRDGELDPRRWKAVDAESEGEAIKASLEKEFDNRPTIMYISVGKARHKNGSPMVVKELTIKWGEKRVQAGN